MHPSTNPGPAPNALRELFDLAVRLTGICEAQAKRIGELEAALEGIRPGWESFNEVDGRVGALESWQEDAGAALRAVQEKMGVLEGKTAWKYVGKRSHGDGVAVCFTKASIVASERETWEMPLESVRFLVEKTYGPGTPDLDAARRCLDGRLIPPGLEEAIESVAAGAGGKPVLRYGEQLRQLIQQQKADASHASPQPSGDAVEHASPQSGGDAGPMGARDYLRRKPLTQDEQAALDYIMRNGRLYKEDIRALKAFLSGESTPQEVLMTLVYRDLVRKEQVDGRWVFIPTVPSPQQDSGEGGGGT